MRQKTTNNKKMVSPRNHVAKVLWSPKFRQRIETSSCTKKKDTYDEDMVDVEMDIEW